MPIQRIFLRRGTTSEWDLANPVLGAGEPGFATDTGVLKMGDGVNTWTALQPFTRGEKVDRPTADEKVVYVTARGNDANDGLTLKGAKATLAAAVTALGGPGTIQLGHGTITTAATLNLPSGVRLVGLGPAATTITYTGAGTFITNPTPGTRIYNWHIEGLSIIGPGKASAAVGVDLDSVSTGHFENVRVSSFGTGWRMRSTTSGGAVYNTFVNCNGSTCGTGFSIEALSSNAARFFACRANGCDVGVDITDTNNTTWYGGQIEVNTVGWRVNATAAGLSDLNLCHGTRFENNTTAWSLTSANVRYTLISDPMPFGTYTFVDNGTQTQTWGGSAATLRHQMGSVVQSASGSWRFTRSANGGTETPAMVVADSNTAAGTPVTVQAETERATGYPFRAIRGGVTYWDVDAAGNTRAPQGSYHEMKERTDPPAPAVDTARLYVRDNGAGKTQLCVRFATGAVQVISTEP